MARGHDASQTRYRTIPYRRTAYRYRVTLPLLSGCFVMSLHVDFLVPTMSAINLVVIGKNYEPLYITESADLENRSVAEHHLVSVEVIFGLPRVACGRPSLLLASTATHAPCHTGSIRTTLRNESWICMQGTWGIWNGRHVDRTSVFRGRHASLWCTSCLFYHVRALFLYYSIARHLLT